MTEEKRSMDKCLSSVLGLLCHGGGGNAQQVLLDDIVITGVPEPSTTALLGLGGLALILRRRK